MDNHDILSYIFNINAHIENGHPLATARHASQVCNSWRSVMLASSEIWGRSLELAELQIEKDESPWRDLVLERTGIAPLHFRGKIDSPFRFEWFIEFISNLWERIHSIDITQTSYKHIPAIDLDFMNSPSSCVVLNVPYIHFNLDAPWISNIRSITLGMGFTSTKLLDCLANMPRLEKARLSAWFPDYLPNDMAARPVHPQRIHLPLLTDLHIEHSYTVVADVLQRIVASTKCSYSIVTIDDATTEGTQRDVFSAYLQRQINLHPGHKLNVYVLNKKVAVSLRPGGPGESTYFHAHSMDLSSVPEEDITTYMSLFYHGNSTFNTVTHVNLNVDMPNEDDIQLIFDSVAQFLLSFPSVTTLELSEQSLFLFTQIYRPDGQLINEQLFPSLKKLVFGYSNSDFKFPVQELLMIFLDQRRSYERAIEELSFGPNIEKLNMDWGCLEEFDEMKVAFELVLRDGRTIVGTYMCGNGKPEELDLTEGWEDRFFQGV